MNDQKPVVSRSLLRRLAAQRQTTFKDLPIGGRQAHRLLDGRCVIRIDITQEGYNAVLFPDVQLTKIEDDASVMLSEKIGFTQY